MSTKLFIGSKYQIETTIFDMNFRVTQKTNRVYALAYLDDTNTERIFYVGITDDYERRWNQHLHAIKKGSDPKHAYFYARRVGVDKVYMVQLDPLGEFSEAVWKTILEEQGHPLQNVAGCRRAPQPA